MLLVSPLPGIDPPGGDVTYTEALLQNPPKGVEYESHDEAMARGTLREHGRRTALEYAIRTRRGIGKETAQVALNKGLTALRRRNVLFREPFRFFSIHSSEYDLIHMHVFSASFGTARCPIVVSNGGELSELYRHLRGMSDTAIRRRQRADRVLGRLFGVQVSSEYLPDVSRLMTYSETAAASFAARGVLPRERIVVAPPFLPLSPAMPAPATPRVVGFIARNFQHKGGPTLLQAWQIVRRERGDARLLIVGSEPELAAAEGARQGITWRPYVKRDELLREVLPMIDVFAYPTAYDYLPSLTLLEAMSRGLPIAASDHGAMAEVLDYGGAGLMSPKFDAPALAANLLRLLDPVENAHFRRAARDQFERRYTSGVVGATIRSCYDAALAQHDSAGADTRKRA